MLEEEIKRGDRKNKNIPSLNLLFLKERTEIHSLLIFVIILKFIKKTK